MLADCTAHSAAEPRLKLLYDLPLLLLPAVAQPLAALLPYGCGTPLAGTALPILQKYAVISVYRQSHQCGERSNAAFGKQSAAELSSLAPHDSKARLISVTTRRRFMAKPCTPHPHCAARAALQAANPQWRGQGAAPLAFSWGSKGAILSRERMAPLSVQRHRRCLSLPRRARETPSPVGQIKKVQLFLKNPLDKWAPRAIMQPTSEDLQTYDGEK